MTARALPPPQPSPAPAHWLLLDAGNTATKWALVPAPEHAAPMPEHATSMPAHAGTRADAFTVLARDHLANAAPDLAGRLAARWKEAAGPGARITAAWGCCVAAPAVAARLQSAAHDCGAALRWLAARDRFEGAGTTLVNGYRDPAQLGADRWHALIAARARWPDTALVVVNAGTATTVDAIDAAGRFRGGVIAPGVRLMLDSLARGTARLPDLQALPASPGAPAGAGPPARATASAALATHTDRTPASVGLPTDTHHANASAGLPVDTDRAIVGGVLGAQVGLVAEVVRIAAPARLVFAGGQGAALAQAWHERRPPGHRSPGAKGSADSPIQVTVDDILVLRGVWLHALSIR